MTLPLGERTGADTEATPASLDALRVLPRQQHLSRGAGAHGELRAHRDRVAQARGTLDRRGADAQVALAAVQLRRLAGDVAQARQHRPGGGQEAVLTGRRSQLGQPRAEHETPL